MRRVWTRSLRHATRPAGRRHAKVTPMMGGKSEYEAHLELRASREREQVRPHAVGSTASSDYLFRRIPALVTPLELLGDTDEDD